VREVKGTGFQINFKELNNLDVTQSQWEAKVKALKDLLTHHLKEEEEELLEGRKIFVTQGRKSLQICICRKSKSFKRRFPSQRLQWRQNCKTIDEGQRMSNMSYNIAHFIGELSVVGYGMLDIQKLNFTQLLLLSC